MHLGESSQAAGGGFLDEVSVFSTPPGGAAWCFTGVEGRAKMEAMVKKTGGKHPSACHFCCSLRN